MPPCSHSTAISKTLVDFNDPDKEAVADKPALIRSQLKDRTPTWNQTDLGTALIRAAEILDETIDREESDDALQIIVISDMQRGADLKALQIYEWPERCAGGNQTGFAQRSFQRLAATFGRGGRGIAANRAAGPRDQRGRGCGRAVPRELGRREKPAR